MQFTDYELIIEEKCARKLSYYQLEKLSTSGYVEYNHQIKYIVSIHKSTFKNLRELGDQVGSEIGISPWRIISQKDIDQFAHLTGDLQWIHIDADKCAIDSPYGQTIAHGFFVLSLASQFCQECYTITSLVMGVNYGLERVRFPHATASGSKIRARISLLNFTEIDAGARITLQVHFELEGIEKPACVAELVALLYEKSNS